MSWTHYSKILVVGVLLAVSLGAAGTAAGFSFNDDGVSEEMEVSEQETATVVMEEPFAERNPGWTVVVDSQFEEASVTITAETPTETIQESGSGQAQLTLDNEAINEVEIEVSGQVPTVEEYNYNDPEQENFAVMTVSDSESGVIETWEVHRYTEESRQARERLDEASEYANEEDDDFQSAITLYNSREFEQSMTEADAIIDDAESGEQTQTLLLLGGAVVVLLLLAGGGYYAYKQRSQNTNKLQ